MFRGGGYQDAGLDNSLRPWSQSLQAVDLVLVFNPLLSGPFIRPGFRTQDWLQVLVNLSAAYYATHIFRINLLENIRCIGWIDRDIGVHEHDALVLRSPILTQNDAFLP